MNDKFGNFIKKAVPVVIIAILLLLSYRLKGNENATANNEASNISGTVVKEKALVVTNEGTVENVAEDADDDIDILTDEYDVEAKLEDDNVKNEPDAGNQDVKSVDATNTILDEDGKYYDYESVILYLDTYGKLPSNYITKSKAKKLGWEGGSVDDYFPGGAIGGGKFGNNEGLLPSGDGIQYYECDIDTNGKSSRGAKRVVYSNEPKYYYTTDHYESFTRYEVVDGQVVKAQ